MSSPPQDSSTPVTSSTSSIISTTSSDTSSSSSTTSTTTPLPPPTTSSTPPETTSTSTSSSAPPPTTTSTPDPTTSSTTEESTPPIITTTSSPSTTSSTTITHASTQTKNGVTETVIITSVKPVPSDPSQTQASSTVPYSPGNSSSSSGGGLDQGSTIAVAVVVPVVGVALLVVAAIFLWKKRKQRKDAEEERRKEVEDYNYNPNDPNLPGGAAGGYAMKEDSSSGYRGWGSTVAGSTGRKGSTTMSGGVPGVAYSDATTPRAGQSDTRSGDGDGMAHSPEGEILGAMGPATAENRGANVARGPSNASSSYSAAGRSDGSAETGNVYGGSNYYDQYGSNPYGENTQRASDGAAQPVIRDNPARRNTRIENPSHFPQQSAGISQNF